MKFLTTFLFALSIFSITNNTLAAEKLFNVVVTNPSSDQRAVAFVDTVTGKNRLVEVNMSGNVVWEWDMPSKLDTRNICKGADINYLPSTDSFLFVLPKSGAYIVNRNGDYKTVVEDNQITHDIDQLPNGNFIYTRGWVNKGEDEVREITPAGQLVWKWSHASYFTNRERFLSSLPKKALKHGLRGTLKKDGVDWAHVNGVERYPNGDTLISMRNFFMFVIVAPDGIPKQTFKHIRLIHEPHRTDFGYIAADRAMRRGVWKHAILRIEDDGSTQKTLLPGQFKTVRGIEQLPNKRYNITSSGNVFEMSSDGTIFQRMHLSIQSEDAERDLNTRQKLPKNTLSEGRCASKNLYKVAKTKTY